MSDTTGGNANDLIRNLTRQGMDETLKEVDRARIAAEAAKKKQEEAEEAAQKEAAQKRAANNTGPVPTHPRFDPELVKRCEKHKRVTDNWIEMLKMMGEIVGKEWHELAWGSKCIHIYYRLGKQLIDDILEGNYVAAGYVVENASVFAEMKDVALIAQCTTIWVKTLLNIGEMARAQGYAKVMSDQFERIEGPMNNACTDGPYALFTAFANSDPKIEVIDDNEVRRRYERLMQYIANLLDEKIQLHFVD